ncbi:NAD(P)/FAD-dependent oxidoreductase [Lichenicoccus sp.]|uniref:NAD(P)/FAD-dependent oxidoreductase n=1 Tax=Lichenicoccus sp. TaxID=2781899 RepID=UPI003D138D33
MSGTLARRAAEVFETWAVSPSWAGVIGRAAQAALLLVARVWLSQAIFVHQLMTMMHARGFAETPPVGVTMVQGVAPLLLATGLLTRPVALLLALGVGLDDAGAMLTKPRLLLLAWLAVGGSGPLSLDFLLGRGLARVPVWAVRTGNRFYNRLDALAGVALPLVTRLGVAFVIAAGSGFAIWAVPGTGALVTAPWWLLLPCWALIFGAVTRISALLLCGLAPAVFSGTTAGHFDVVLLLALLVSSGAGPASLDAVFARWIRLVWRRRDRANRVAPHVVVVGGGFGGIAVVRALRQAACRITLVDRSNHTVFQPLLYQVATAALSPADIAAPIRSVLRGQANVAVRLGEVTGIDGAAREVVLTHGRIPFDHLVLATGARHSYFGQDHWAAHAPGLKSIDDATAMRGRMLLAFERAEGAVDPAERQALLTFVVVGGGPTGVELAGAVAEFARTGLDKEYRAINPASARVVLVQSAPRVLPAFSAMLSARAERALHQLGVEVRTGAKVTHISQDGVAIDSDQLAARTVFWAAGVAASPAAAWLGQAGDAAGRVIVDDDLSVPGWSGVYAIGDTAASKGWGGAAVPGLAPAAKQQGRYVARAIRAAAEGRAMSDSFRYRHYGNLATIGRLAAVLELRRLRLWGAPAWWFWGAAHVLLLAGGRNRAAVVLNWLWAYLTYKRGTRLITGRDIAAGVDNKMNNTAEPSLHMGRSVVYSGRASANRS